MYSILLLAGLLLVLLRTLLFDPFSRRGALPELGLELRQYRLGHAASKIYLHKDDR